MPPPGTAARRASVRGEGGRASALDASSQTSRVRRNAARPAASRPRAPRARPLPSQELKLAVWNYVKLGVREGIPFSLLITFVFCPGVSATIFKSWACAPYQVDWDGNEYWYYLRIYP